MHIKVKKNVFHKMTEDELENVGHHKSWLKHTDSITVRLAGLQPDALDAFRAALVRVKDLGTRNMGRMITDIDRWVKIINTGTSGDARPRSLEQFSDLVTEFIRNAPRRWLYKQQPSGEWLAYYVNYVDYEQEHRSRDYYYEAKVEIHLTYMLFGEERHDVERFRSADCDRRTVLQALADRGLLIETPDLRKRYQDAEARYADVSPRIGHQYTSQGYGVPISRSRYSDDSNQYPLMREGIPAKLVVDVVKEAGEETESRGSRYVQTHFWYQVTPAATKSIDSDDLAGNRDILDNTPKKALVRAPVIPIHPYVPVYHLSRHQRYRVHVLELDDYVFNKQLGDQLVLPQITKDLVNVLVSQGRVNFTDIIEGKGAGVCILLGGAPGVGKTLTAEVFAEATERPLLNMQAAQLGIKPDTIEENLERVLTRGSRWNAVVLLDEADVYINERGHDLQQNAIVAAFLRILEHHTATIFMTTNHIQAVDDAVASRCLARIDYAMPSASDQRKIWGIMNHLNNLGLTDSQLDHVVAHHDDLSGRDIKQICKLASLWAASQGRDIDQEVIAFVRMFLPNRISGVPA